METAPTKLKRINVMLCPELWKEIRQRGLDRGQSGSSVLRDLVSEALRGSTDPKPRRKRNASHSG